MRGKRLVITPKLRDRIIAALQCDEKPTLKVLSKRFGMGRDKIYEIRRQAILSDKIVVYSKVKE